MDYKISFSDEAERDFLYAGVWYGTQREDLADLFTEAVRNAILKIQSNPFAYGFRSGNLRGCKIDTFPYLILFFVEKLTINIVAVFHMSQKPLK